MPVVPYFYQLPPTLPLTVNLTGVFATAAAAALVPNILIAMSGVSGSGVVRAPSISENITLTGTNATGAAQGVTSQDTVSLTGSNASGAIGSLAISESITLIGVNATGSVTAIIAGVALVAASASGVSQSLTPQIAFSLVGSNAIGSANSVISEPLVTLASISAIGVTGSLLPVVSLNLGAQPGIATAAALLIGVSDRLVGTDGVGMAAPVGVITLTNVFIGGINASGVVGTIIADVLPTTLTGVNASGATQEIDPLRHLVGVNGSGVATPFAPSITVLDLVGSSAFAAAQAIVQAPGPDLSGANASGAAGGIALFSLAMGFSPLAAGGPMLSRIASFAINEPSVTISGVTALATFDAITGFNEASNPHGVSATGVAVSGAEVLTALGGVNAVGAALALDTPPIILVPPATAFGLATAITVPAADLVGDVAATGAAGALPVARLIGVPDTGVAAIGTVSNITAPDIIIGVSALGSASALPFAIVNQPVLSGASAISAAHGLTPFVINSAFGAGVAGLFNPDGIPFIQDRHATGMAGGISGYHLLTGVFGMGVAAIFIISTGNNAINVHPLATANIIVIDSTGAMSIIGGASKNLPIG